MDGGPSRMYAMFEISILKLSVITTGRVRPLLASIMSLSS